MEGLLDIDRELYDSCRDYADRLIQQKLHKSSSFICDGCRGIRELCKRCPYLNSSACIESDIG